MWLDTGETDCARVFAFDISKAFDSANHFTLFNKFRELPTNPYIGLLLFFLFSSQQRVIPDGNMIPFLPINRDMHQGTILGPIRFSLSNDPGKKGSNFFYCGAIRFPQIEMFSFLRRKCINLQKRSLRKKMYLNSTFKGCILC